MDSADASTNTQTTADPSHQSHPVKLMERRGFTSRVCSVLVMVKQRELHGILEEVIKELIIAVSIKPITGCRPS